MKVLIISLFFSFLSFGESYDHHSFKKFDIPERSFSIILSDEGYYPSEIVAFEGEKINFFVTSTTNDTQCLLLKGHELFLSASRGKISFGEVILKDVGEFQYYCPGYESVGRVIVLGKSKAKKSIFHKSKPSGARTLASDKDESGEWKPKDF